jgi:hypothetical protein
MAQAVGIVSMDGFLVLSRPDCIDRHDCFVVGGPSSTRIEVVAEMTVLMN